MDITQPEPALLQHSSPRMSFDASTENLDMTQHVRPKSEFDPCANAKISSPFYLYNHDSPRPSFNKSRPDINIAVQDLEAGLTPQSTRPSPALNEKRGSNDSGNVRNGSWRYPRLSRQESRPLTRCMTKPKVSKWKSLPHRQRLIIKSLISLIMVGLIIGLAVGLTKALGGGVWRSQNSTSSIE